MDNYNFKTTESGYKQRLSKKSTSSSSPSPPPLLPSSRQVPVTVVLDDAQLPTTSNHHYDNNNNNIIIAIKNRNKKSEDSTNQYSSKLTTSDLDSRCNTVDYLSDLDRNNNEIFDDDLNNQHNAFPGFVEKSLCFTKKSILRVWCLRMITSPYPFR